MKSLKFKNKYICDENDVVLAELDVRMHVPDDEQYAVYLKRIFDNKPVSELREYLSATDILQATTIIEAAMKASFKKQLEEKLHQCMLATDSVYRQAFELAQLKESVKLLEKELAEERRNRCKIESELYGLKSELQSLKETKSEFESESETDN